MDDKDIIEVEVVSEKKTRVEEPSKTEVLLSDYSMEISRYARLSNIFFRFGRLGVFLFIILGFAFSILYSQNQTPANLFVMILGWSLSGVSVILWIIGQLFHLRMLHFMSLDPNYSTRE